MFKIKNKVKNILGIISIGILFTGTVLGTIIKIDNAKNNSNQALNQDYYLNNFKNEEKTLVCSYLLEEALEKDDATFALGEYANEVEIVECLFVGCGGFF